MAGYAIYGGCHTACPRCDERVYLYDSGESGYGGHSCSEYGCRLERCKVTGSSIDPSRRLSQYKVSKEVCGDCKCCVFKAGHYKDKHLSHPRLIFDCNAKECIRKEKVDAYLEREAKLFKEFDSIDSEKRKKIIKERSTVWNETHERSD